MFNVIDQYNSFVENNFIKKNKDQIEFLKQADNVWSSFCLLYTSDAADDP